ncbi:MAG: IS607 family transposase, partial [Candidatus Hodarchaeales archaeon]
MRISEAARYLSVCTKTIRRWDAAGKLSCFRTPGGHRRIAIMEIQRLLGKNMPESLVKKTAIYSRVSSHEQKKKGDLARQIEIA